MKQVKREESKTTPATIDGKRVGFRDAEGQLYLTRCPKCERENWAMAVASGQCAWCQWSEEDKQEQEGGK